MPRFLPELIGIRPILIRHPFPRIAGHIVEAVAVRRIRSDFFRPFVFRVGALRIIFIAIRKDVAFKSFGGFFPFRLSRQAHRPPDLLAEPFAIGIRFIQRDADHRHVILPVFIGRFIRFPQARGRPVIRIHKLRPNIFAH